MQSGETHMELKALRRLGWTVTALARVCRPALPRRSYPGSRAGYG